MFLDSQCFFSELTDELISTCQPFSCGNEDLDDFFKNDATRYAYYLMGKSYCFRKTDDPTKIVCAFTVSVYLFMSNSRNIRFKTRVEACEVPREDSDFWIEKAPKDLTSRLRLVAENNSALLKEENLKKHHFNGGRSLQRPIYKNEQLIAYIQENF